MLIYYGILVYLNTGVAFISEADRTIPKLKYGLNLLKAQNCLVGGVFTAAYAVDADLQALYYTWGQAGG